jgi:ferredoxin
MRIVVDRDLCTGQAMCESIAPDLFRVTEEDGQAEIQVAVVPDGRLSGAELAVTCCPNGALELKP